MSWLRNYQEDLVEKMRQSMRCRHRAVLAVSPTGSGKTPMATFVTSETMQKGLPVWFICHRSELVDGTSKTFTKFGIQHSFIAAGKYHRPFELVKICSIDTLKNRLAVLTPPKVAIIDEAHHCAAAGWKLVVDWLRKNGTLIIGFTATPLRLDGRPLDDLFDDLVEGPKVSWLIDNGFLSPYDAYIPNVISGKGIAKDSKGEFSKKQLAAATDLDPLNENVVKWWSEYASGTRTIGFAVNVTHSMRLVECFKSHGISAAHVDGAMDKSERRKIISAYADGDIDVMFNVGLFDEGFDLASIAQRDDVTIDTVIMDRKTQSLGRYLQMAGRALRPKLGKRAVLLDFVGNILTHGFPDDERKWSLSKGCEEVSKSDGVAGPPPPIICGRCFKAIKRPLPLSMLCPHCGSQLIERKEDKVIKLNMDAHQMVKVGEEERKQIQITLKQEQAMAKTIDELVSVGRKRGYKNPVTWANKVFAGRMAKR